MRIAKGASLVCSFVFLLLQLGCTGAVAQPNASSSTPSTAPDAPKITTTSLPTAQTGVSYSAPLSVSGGVAPFHWSIASNNLPSGLSIDSGSGTISGKAEAPADSDIEVMVTDSVNVSA